jgi:hypothetical protein
MAALSPSARFLLLLLVGIVGPLTGCRGDAPADETAPVQSLASPPALEVGDWWTVEVDPVLVGATFETTLVVTHVGDGTARIGMAPETFRDDFLVIHVPVLGDVDLETFAWRVMWDDFEALRFPLEPGATWSADFHGNDVTATVERVEGSRAFIVMEGEGERIDMVYDAAAGMITEFREEALQLGFRVTDHGTGYTGPVRSLSGIELGLMQGGPSGEEESSTATLEVDTQGTHGSLSLVVWNRGSEDQAGRYRIVSTAPDGTVFEHAFEVAPGDPSVLVQSFGHDAVQGTWTLDFERDGPAGLLVELFTYGLEEFAMGEGAAAGAEAEAVSLGEMVDVVLADGNVALGVAIQVTRPDGTMQPGYFAGPRPLAEVMSEGTWTFPADALPARARLLGPDEALRARGS